MKKSLLLTVCLIGAGGIVFALTRNSERRLIPDAEKILERKENSEPLGVLKNPFISVKKKERKLYLYDGENLVKTYNVGLGFSPVGDKQKQGDGKTPEGNFYIFTKNPKSSYYLSLGISYPSIDDAKIGLEKKLISKSEHDAIIKAIGNRQMPPQKTKLGGEIYIHGEGGSSDWTLGCIALDNADMKQLFDAIPQGTNVRIEP